MDPRSHSIFFNSFLCSNPDCQETKSNENTLLNCFHTVCNTHLESGEIEHCSNQECLLMLEKSPNFISIPSQLDECRNPVSCHIAKQLSGLKSTRESGDKCKMCDSAENLVFCIDCSSAWCEDHRNNFHFKFGRSHVFVPLSGSSEEIVTEILMESRNVPKTLTDDGLNSVIDALKSRKDQMAFNMVNFENRMREFQDKTIRITEETERDFDKIKKHIEIIKEKNLENLKIKSDKFLRELHEKMQILRFKADATDRALNIASCVLNARLKTDPNFVQLLRESNGLHLSDKLTEMPNPPIEHTNVPKVVKRISNELARIYTFIPCDENQYNAQYSLNDKDGPRYCISTHPPAPISREPPTIMYLFFKTFLTPSNISEYVITRHYTGGTSKRDEPIFAEHFPIDGHYRYFRFSLEPDLKQIDVQINTTGGNSYAPLKIDFLLPLTRIVPSLSTLRVEPGHLTSLTKSRNKIFAICKDANQIRRYDARPQVIAPTEDNAPTVWNSEATFGVGHLIDPTAICAFQSIIFVSDCFHHAVLCFTTDGSYITKFGSVGTGKGQFQLPMGMAVDQVNGKLAVADSMNNRIQILILDCQDFGWESFQADGEIELKGMPVDVKIDTLGTFFILTRSAEILKYDRFYKYYGSILYYDSIVPLMPFFTIDNNDVIYVCSQKEDGCVYMITEREGEDAYNLRRHPVMPKRLNLSGLTVDEDFRLFLAHNEPFVPTDPTRSLVYVSDA